jgi:hypothetical protein
MKTSVETAPAEPADTRPIAERRFAGQQPQLATNTFYRTYAAAVLPQ